MEAASMRSREAPLDYLRGVDWGAVWTWGLCFALVVYLGLEGGGYDPLVSEPIGIAVWWVLLGGVLVGALPRLRPGRLVWVSLGLFLAFAAWTALSLAWTESSGNTAGELARVLGYLGAFALALFSRGSREAQRVIGAVAAAIVVVALVGLLSRLHPGWFAPTDTPGVLTERERLSYPINYWNGLAGLIAIGLPLLLQVATCARSALARALAAAAFPAMAMTIFLTLSRGGIAAAVIAVAAFVVLTSDRLPKLLALLVMGAGSAVLIAATESRDALQHGALNDLARQQGTELLWIGIVVCLVVGLLQAALSSSAVGDRRPGWTRVSRPNAVAATAVGLVALVIAAAALGAPGRVSNGWDEFKEGGGAGSGAGRLGSVAGQSRYQLWSAAVRENRSKPLTGTGAGTFEFWWARDGDTNESVRDTHSLYLQTLGELGIVGLALLAAFLLSIFVAGGRGLIVSRSRNRPLFAAGIAGALAFCITAVFDWMWQIPVLPVAMLLLGSVLVMRPEDPAAEAGSAKNGRLPTTLRVAIAVAALVAIVAIAIPLATTSLVRQSESDARSGDLAAALQDARSAQNVQPDAAGPRLQQALVLEAQGDLAAAAGAALAATERESTNWRTWLVLSRIEAERGRAEAAVRAYGKARSLNPRSELFAR
jgi:Flp pilus assembly protein TadD